MTYLTSIVKVEDNKLYLFIFIFTFYFILYLFSNFFELRIKG